MLSKIVHKISSIQASHSHIIPKIGSKEYKEHIKEEIEHYKEKFSEGLTEKVPPIWYEVEKHFASEVERVTGSFGYAEYIVEKAILASKKNAGIVRIYSIGSGACGIEIEKIAPDLKKKGVRYKIVCTDINPDILAKAKKEARKRKLNIETHIADANKLKLPHNTYDFIIAHAALHHFIKLDDIARKINKSLKPDGLFVTVDIPTRSGYRMWTETYMLFLFLWMLLPRKFKLAHTGFAQPLYVRLPRNVDYAQNSFECVNSEDVVPSLRKYLREEVYVPALALMRRFFDTQYGPNYNINKKLDMTIFKIVTSLDTFCSRKGLLKPETFFGVYSKK